MSSGETIADILAQLRRWAEQGLAINPGYIADRYATAAKAMHECERYKTTAPIPPGGWGLGDAFTWLFAPAEGGAE